MKSILLAVIIIVSLVPAHAQEILKRLNLQVTESEVLCVNLSNKPGALADVATRLSEAHININYCYVTAGARGGRTTGILKVADLKKAMHILEKSSPGKSARTARRKALRPSPSRRGR